MRVTFDSNVWEEVFKPEETKWEIIREKLRSHALEGFICEAAFRIEAIRKSERQRYFAEPKTNFQAKFDPIGKRVGVHISLGPADHLHPGISATQMQKLEEAVLHGVKVLHGHNWLGLPTPQVRILLDNYATETQVVRAAREYKHAVVFQEIKDRGVGKAAFDSNGGWRSPPSGDADLKRFAAACAEWADAEVVAAHIAYGNEILCTNDLGKSAGKSVFNKENREWLTTAYNVVFHSPDDLCDLIK